MAVVGTVAYSEKNGILTGTWTVSSGAAAGNVSTELPLRGYEICEWYLSAPTGISAGTHTVGMCMTSTGLGQIPADAGRSVRASYAFTGSLSTTGYVKSPPPQARLVCTALGTDVTAYTVTFTALPIASYSVKHGRS
jgi:hypothetical protein